jgi:hypothetical protein
MSRSKTRPVKKPRSSPIATPESGDHIPTDAEMAAAVGSLDAGDRRTFQRVIEILVRSLGSMDAARLWLVTNGTGFRANALETIRDGKVNVVLATLESSCGSSPTYA